MMLEQTITVATFNDAAQAEALKDRLIDKGLHADILDESGTQQIWFWTSDPKAHMRVRVQKDDLDRANALIEEWSRNNDSVLSGAVRCPQCGSSRVEYPAMSRRTTGTFFFSALLAAKIIPREYYCESCQYTWPDKVPEQPDLDPLNWPRGGKETK